MKQKNLLLLLLILSIIILFHLQIKENFETSILKDKTKVKSEFYQEDTNDYMEYTNLMKIPPQLYTKKL